MKGEILKGEILKMVRKKQSARELAEKDVVRFRLNGSVTEKQLYADLRKLDFDRFNLKYGSHFRSQESFEGTRRRILANYNFHIQILIKNQKENDLPRVKNVWNLKQGVRGISGQHVTIRVLADIVCEKGITRDKFITARSLFSTQKELSELKEEAERKLNIIEGKYETSDCEVIEKKRIIYTFRRL